MDENIPVGQPDGSDTAYCKLCSVLRTLYILVCLGHNDLAFLTAIWR